MGVVLRGGNAVGAYGDYQVQNGYPDWEYAFLKAIGAPIQQVQLEALNRWMAHENTGSDLGKKEWNPLAITDPNNFAGPSAGTINSVGVAKFKSQSQFINAMVNFLQAPEYQPLLKELKNPDATLTSIGNAIPTNAWGGDGAYVAAGSLTDGTQTSNPASAPVATAPVTGSYATGPTNSAGYGCSGKDKVDVPFLGFTLWDACRQKALFSGLIIGTSVVMMGFGLTLMVRHIGAGATTKAVGAAASSYAGAIQKVALFPNKAVNSAASSHAASIQKLS